MDACLRYKDKGGYVHMEKRQDNQLIGIILILLGFYWACRALGVFHFSIFFDGWWSFIIIIPCALNYIQGKSRGTSIGGILLGVLLLLWRQDIIPGSYIPAIFLSLVFVMIGISIMMSGPKVQPAQKADSTSGANRYQQRAEYDAGMDGNQQSYDYQESSAYQQSDEYQENNRYQQSGEYQENNRYQQSGEYQENNRYQQSNEYQENNRYQNGREYQESYRYQQSSDYQEDCVYQQGGGYQENSEYQQEKTDTWPYGEEETYSEEASGTQSSNKGRQTSNENYSTFETCPPNISAILIGKSVSCLNGVFRGTNIQAVLGNVQLDLRQAELEQDVYVNVNLIFGGADIFVPDNARVICETQSILGDVRDVRKSRINISPTQPAIHIVGTCILGGLELK